MPEAYRKLCDACITFYFRCTDDVERGAELRKELKKRLRNYRRLGSEYMGVLPLRTRIGYVIFDICPAAYKKLLGRIQRS